MSSNSNIDLTSSSNDINLAAKYYVNNCDDNKNFKKELIKLLKGLKEGLKEISERL